MTATDTLIFSFSALWGHRLRTLLSLGGMSIGVGAVVLLTAMGEGARRYVIEQFASLGGNLVITLPGRNETTGAIPGIAGVPNDLTLQDAEAVLRGVPTKRCTSRLNTMKRNAWPKNGSAIWVRQRSGPSAAVLFALPWKRTLPI